jgi:hypothetical protein
MNDKELRLNFDPPPVAALPPQNQQEEEDPEELNEPESEQEQPPAPAPKAQPARTRRKTSADPKASDMKVISETGVKLVEVPFDIEPETQKPEVKSSSLGDTIIAIEKWAKAAAVKHDQDGLPDLSDPGYLMERVYEVLAQRGLVDPRADSWYSWLNQIAKLTGSSEEVVDLLVKVNKQVRDEYAGVPDEVLVADEEGPVANDPPAESHGQRVAAIEAWMTKAVDQFAAKGVEGFAKPSDVLEAMYSVAVKQGLVKGKSAGWRPRVTDLAESKVSIHDLTQIFAAEARAIVQHYASDNGGREPGSEG